ncbi:Tfp pilus assembly protein FimT/FimU [Marinobacter sp. P4B1]|uniref:pilus assembly FimT family protein n=1 Tax=Marinobacter sp. P4B1 TaxID=1119533 RepID=UPI001D0D145D|nr:type II secretion system protein [Marinobacter sp. P4B1]
MRRRLYSDRLEGYSLVELILVISLIGVLSALGIGLYTRSSAFSPLLATQQLASATLLAQQAALAGNSANTVTISRDTKSFSFSAAGSSFSMRHEGATMSYRPVSQTAASPVTSTNTQIAFDRMGRIAPPVSGQDIEFKISGDSNFTLCLSSLGAVYQGACQ